MTATVLHLALPGHELRRAPARARETIARFLERTGWAFRLPTICVVNGAPVLRRDWRKVRIRATDKVTFLSRPLGGGRGGIKGILGLVAVIALAAFAPWAAGAISGALGLGATATSLISAGILVGGSLLINALVAPKPGGQDRPQDAQIDQIYSVSASGNVARPLQTIPVQYGRVKTFPDFAATPWSEFIGNDQYLNVLLCRGLGSYQTHKIYIDDTQLWDESTGINPAFDGVQVALYEPNENVTLFPTNVVQASEVSGQQFPDPNTDPDGGWLGGFIANAAGTEASAIAVDLVFPAGCFTVNQENGELESSSVGIEVQARRVNDAGAPISGYSAIISEFVTYTARSPVRLSFKATIGAGRWEVRARRTNSPLSGSSGSNELAWAGLRAFVDGPKSYPASTLAIRIKATAQLTESSSRRFAVLQTRKLSVWNGSSFVTQATRSPAWALWDMATNTDYGLKRPPSKVDFQAIADLATAAESRGDTFDYCFTTAVIGPEAMDMVLKSTRARHRWSGDVLTLVRDEWRPVPQMLLTDREIVRGSLSIDWVMNPDEGADCVICEYLDEDTWRPAEVQYPPNSVDFTATNPTRIRLDGIVNREQAYREAAFYYLQSQYRRTIISLTTEHDGRMLSFGSAVRVQTELPMSWGATGAIVGRSSNTLTLDPAPEWASSGQHSIAIRTKTGKMFGPVLCTRGSDDSKAVLNLPDLEDVETAQGMTLDDALDRADGAEEPSFAFGVGESRARDCIVMSGQPQGDQVRLVLSVDDERVHATELPDVPAPPTVPDLQDPAAPTVVALYANFRQGQLEPILDASWWPAPGAIYYRAEVSYDGGNSWQQIYEGVGTSFSVVVDRAALRLRVQAIGLRVGAYSVVDVQAPEIALAPGSVNPNSLTHGFRDFVTNQLSGLAEQVDFALQRIARLAAEQDAANYLDKIAQRTLLQHAEDNINIVIRETAQIATTIEGRLGAAWFLSIDNNGYISGIAAYNDQTTSSFTIIADQFRVAFPEQAGGAPTEVFAIGNYGGNAKIGIRGDMFLDGTITAQALNVNQLSAISANFGTATFSGQITASNGKMIIDLNSGYIAWYD